MHSCQIISNARYYLNHVDLWLNLKVEKSIYNSTQYVQFIKTLFSFSWVQETFKTFKTNIDATFDVSSINTPLSNGIFERWIVITWFCECIRFQRFFFLVFESTSLHGRFLCHLKAPFIDHMQTFPHLNRNILCFTLGNMHSNVCPCPPFEPTPSLEKKIQNVKIIFLNLHTRTKKI